MTEFNQSSY